jgi:hypothetical protein
MDKAQHACICKLPQANVRILLLLLLFILTVNEFVSGSSGNTMRQQTNNTHHTKITPRSNETQHTKLHVNLLEIPQ